MDTKLTIKIDKRVIDKAKGYAYSHNRSLSRMIESYLKSLINQEDSENNEEIEISAFVKSLSTGKKIPADLDYKKEYSDYLMNKYK